MLAPDFLHLFVLPLERLRLEYAVTGSVAAMLYAEPRFTADIDIILNPGSSAKDLLPEAFPAPDFYLPPPEVLAEEARRPEGGHVNVIHPASAQKADLYFKGRDPLNAWALAARRREATDAGEIFVVPPEYIVVRKLIWYRDGRSSKHARDIRSILSVQSGSIDLVDIGRRVDALGLAATWADVTAGAPF